MSSLSLLPTFTAMFQRTVADYRDRPALSTPDGSIRLTWREYGERVRDIATGLASLGVRRGETVGIMLTNRPEFHLIDTATLHTGAVPFSVYNTLPPEQIAHLFGNADNRVVVCEPQFLEPIRKAVATGETWVEHIVCVDADTGDPDTMTLAELERRTTPTFDFDESWQAVEPDDVLTIIYTSGTTGPPKGVEITHAGMRVEIEATSELSGLHAEDSIVSYLPDAHIANRWGMHYSSIASGMHVITLADMKQLIAVLSQTHPSLFGAVPQVWYKLKAGIEAQLAAEKSSLKRRLANWAIDVGKQHARLVSDGQAVPKDLQKRHARADKLVLSKIRERLGLDRVRFAATGAAAIDPEALEFVLALGIPCCEIWGMSETTCAVTVNPPDAIRIGTVGKALPVAELRIAEDGELLVRSSLVMKGYRHDPGRTTETVDSEGWLHTGDIATIDDDGYVRIIDRKKELMINASGKNMSPANIEGTVKANCPLIGSVIAIGDDRPYVVALMTLDPDVAATFAAEHGLASSDASALANDSAVRAAVQAGIDAANERLARVEQVRQFEILPHAWEPGGDEITPTMKLRRKPITRKYARQIEALYAS